MHELPYRSARMAELHVVTLCTGNAARSVMAGVLLAEHVPGLRVTTSGTHVLVSQYAEGEVEKAAIRPRDPRDPVHQGEFDQRSAG